MKTYKYITLSLALCSSLLFVECTDSDENGNVIEQGNCSNGIMDGTETGIDCGGSECEPCTTGLDFSGTYMQEDQMGRPGINTVLGTAGTKDAFNVTVPSEMQAAFQASFEAKLLALNPAYTTNALPGGGLDATTFTTVLSNDVLWVAQTGVTSYFNGTEILTGRALNDDVIDISLYLIFGGPMGTDNDNNPETEPLLTSDGVPANDVAFSTSFPYLASPF